MSRQKGNTFGWLEIDDVVKNSINSERRNKK